MTDTSNQTPVQTPTDNPFFRNVPSDPVQVQDPVTNDQGMTPSNPPPLVPNDPAPVTTDSSNSSALQSDDPVSMNNVQTAGSSLNPIDQSTDLLSDSPTQPLVDTKSESLPVNSTTATELTPAGSTLPENTVSEQSTQDQIATLEPINEASSDQLMPGSNPVMPPQTPVEDTTGATSGVTLDAPVVDAGSAIQSNPLQTDVLPDLNSKPLENNEAVAEVDSSSSSLSSTIDQASEVANEGLPDLNAIAGSVSEMPSQTESTLPPLLGNLDGNPTPVASDQIAQAVEPLEDSVSATAQVDTLSNNLGDTTSSSELTSGQTASLPQIDATLNKVEPAVTADMGIQSGMDMPTLETQPAQPAADPSQMAEQLPTLPPLEPIAQTISSDPVDKPIDSVVAPIAQEIAPTNTDEVKTEKPAEENAVKGNEPATPSAGKMKNLVLLLGVLVVGIMALVLGIIVASTQ